MDYTKPPAQYTPSTSSTPKFGESGDYVLKLQQSLNKQNLGKAGYTPLKEDSMYGPKTYAAANNASELVTTSTASRLDFSKNSLGLDNALRASGIRAIPQSPSTGDDKTAVGTDTSVDSDPYISALNAHAQSSDDSSKLLIRNIIAAKQRSRNAVDKQYENYKGGLQLLGIQHNEAQSSPELLAGHIQEAENQHQEKLQDLDAEEAKLLLDANMAREDRNFKLLKETMDRRDTIKKEKANELKSYYETVSQQDKVSDIVGAQMYDVVTEQIKSLDPKDQEAFLQAISKNYNIPLPGLVKGLATEKERRDKLALDTQDKKSVIANRGGGGSTGLTKKQIDQGKAALDTGKSADGTVLGNPRGSDGFYDPYVYMKVFEEWPGTPKEFVSKYALVGSINPDSYNLLPDALKQLLPKKAGSSRTLPRSAPVPAATPAK